MAKIRGPTGLNQVTLTGRRDSNACGESASELENLAVLSSGSLSELTPDTGSCALVSGGLPFATSVSKITDADMVNAAARAMLEGRGELAELIMREVQLRRERAAVNVVPIQSKRPR
jgi:hypothetical protein